MRPDLATVVARHLRADPSEHAALATHLSSQPPVVSHTLWRSDFEQHLRDSDLTPDERRLAETTLTRMHDTGDHAATIDPDDLNALIWLADEGVIDLTPTEREAVNRTMWTTVAQIATATGRTVDDVADTLLTDFTNYEDDPWWTQPHP